MKITDKILSIPPHISTTWANISSLQMKGLLLVVTLMGGESVNIPGLSLEIIEKIFSTHATFLEQETLAPSSTSHLLSSKGTVSEIELPFRMGFSTLDGIGTALQHNPAHADAPDLPEEILGKIGAIAKIISPETEGDIPKPEPHCNCMHCQIARTIHQNLTDEEDYEEIENIEENAVEDVSEEDLRFSDWDITQTGDKLFSVVKRLDPAEKYSVYLGHPVGCTCGHTGCEHILAVLKS
ncbi:MULTISPECIES: hypothetical protein [Parachlamydia]|jgi:hypothetical protein|uniref:SWIM-type domain-containing protein n=2 Tax=Parachlamydia acanthamoebae TaxID=83552 RepID=F8L0C8_PARAV|nr:hypothetical protein [Parachlamydia acanthamoebae]EFB41628.1 hypothetical protein pah_c026o063 [Parachlamydia acanthamoebae str. Hall's coccus]KIA77571.1 hypothetical protein DB43_GD00020 [Parachlamydia acanthamoebae]CCB86658.1 putative uncharacterized protein [Parachlamydia acanthamoebae UV-7]